VSLEPDAGQMLQFDTALPADAESAAATSAQGVTCVACNQEIADEYYDVNGHSTCDRCRQQIANHAETPKGFGVFGKAGLFGFGAALLGAALYYAVIAITNFEIGLVAIAIGYMVGFAVRKATEDRGGRRFQVLAIVLTYWAVGLAYTPFLFAGLAAENQKQEASAAAPAAGPSPAQPASAEPASADAPPSPAGFALAIAVLLGLSLALPVMSVIGSLPGGLISAAIIAFGMHQAWRMTGAPHLVITGPYRIAPPLPSA
jgi:hypothetical protein